MILLITGISPSRPPSLLYLSLLFHLIPTSLFIFIPLLYLLFRLSSETVFTIDLMEEDTIYFAVGVKSFNVSRISGTQGDLYKWTERNRRCATRTQFTKRTIWLIQRLKEASLVKGNSVRRWKRREVFSETYCARNFNVWTIHRHH